MRSAQGRLTRPIPAPVAGFPAHGANISAKPIVEAPLPANLTTLMTNATLRTQTLLASTRYAFKAEPRKRGDPNYPKFASVDVYLMHASA